MYFLSCQFTAPGGTWLAGGVSAGGFPLGGLIRAQPIPLAAPAGMTEDEKRTAKNEALEKANEVITKLDEGSEFANLAKEYSDDDATKDNGGSMGIVNTIELDDVTRQELTKLEVGKYSTTPVETEYGYEIFLKVSAKEKPELKEVKTHIIETLADEKLTKDTNLQYKGLENIRNEYGFKINDEDLEVYYENTMKNLMNQTTTTE